MRLRAGRTGRARCLAALLASACVPAIALAGCGGSSHTASTAAANANGAATGAADTTTTGTGTSSEGGAQAGTSTTATSTTSSTAASGQGQGNGAGSAATGGGTAKSDPNDPAPSHGSSSGKGATHGGSSAKKPAGTKAAGKSAAGSGSGSGASSSSGAGASGSSGASAPNPGGVPFEVETTSMEPTYQPETTIYYDPTRTHPQVGEVVVFYLPSGAEEGSCGEVMVGGRACSTSRPGITKGKLTSFKRVVGLPGDTIAIREGRVIRNGQPEAEPPILPCGKDEKVECEFPTPITVPAGDYYLMADNRGLAKEDSRIFGAVPQEDILGTVEGG